MEKKTRRKRPDNYNIIVRFPRELAKRMSATIKAQNKGLKNRASINEWLVGAVEFALEFDFRVLPPAPKPPIQINPLKAPAELKRLIARAARMKRVPAKLKEKITAMTEELRRARGGYDVPVEIEELKMGDVFTMEGTNIINPPGPREMAAADAVEAKLRARGYTGLMVCAMCGRTYPVDGKCPGDMCQEAHAQAPGGMVPLTTTPSQRGENVRLSGGDSVEVFKWNGREKLEQLAASIPGLSVGMPEPKAGIPFDEEDAW